MKTLTPNFNPKVNTVPGGNSGGATPVPIPNTAVKSSSADGTWTARSWKSRSLPGTFYIYSLLLYRMSSSDECIALEMHLYWVSFPDASEEGDSEDDASFKLDS